jgi:hypothetical protein
MSFRMICPNCRRILNAAASAFGKTLPCPGCKGPVTVPRPSEAKGLAGVTQKHEPPHRAAAEAADAAGLPILSPEDMPPLPKAEPLREAQRPLSAPALPPSTRPHGPPHAPPAKRICEWCAESIPERALRCPHCTNWRKDIARDRQTFLGVSLGSLVGDILIAWAFFAGLRSGEWNEAYTTTSPGRQIGLITVPSFPEIRYDFSPEKFLKSPEGCALLVGFILCFALWLFVALPAQTRLKRKTGSSWSIFGPG